MPSTNLSLKQLTASLETFKRFFYRHKGKGGTTTKLPPLGKPFLPVFEIH